MHPRRDARHQKSFALELGAAWPEEEHSIERRKKLDADNWSSRQPEKLFPRH